jgi:hypothetical protein
MNSVFRALTHHGALDYFILVVKGEINDVLCESLGLALNVDSDGLTCLAYHSSRQANEVRIRRSLNRQVSG